MMNDMFYMQWFYIEIIIWLISFDSYIVLHAAVLHVYYKHGYEIELSL